MLKLLFLLCLGWQASGLSIKLNNAVDQALLVINGQLKVGMMGSLGILQNSTWIPAGCLGGRKVSLVYLKRIGNVVAAVKGEQLQVTGKLGLVQMDFVYDTCKSATVLRSANFKFDLHRLCEIGELITHMEWLGLACHAMFDHAHDKHDHDHGHDHKH